MATKKASRLLRKNDGDHMAFEPRVLPSSSSSTLLVRCTNCQTQFSLGEGQLGPHGAAVRCSVCGYVFRMEAEAEPSWQVETVDGELFSAPDLATLRSWIAQGRLHPDDRVSRTGKQWLRLGAMPEFSDVFAGFPDLPVVFRTFEPTPLPALPDLGPPPDFNRSDDESQEILPGTVESTPSAEIGLLDFLGDIQSAKVPLDGGFLDRPANDIDDDDLDAPVSGPLRVAEEVSSSHASVQTYTPMAATSAAVAEDAVPAPLPEPHSEPHPEPEREPEEDAPRAKSSGVGHRAVAPVDSAAALFAADEEGLSSRPTEGHSVDDFEIAPARKPWRWMLGAVAVAGVALMFGVGAGLHRLGDSTPQATAEEPDQPRPVGDSIPAEVEQARRAVHRAENLAQMEAVLEAKLETQELTPKAVAAIKLAQVDVLSTRALLSLIAASVDQESTKTWSFRAQDDAVRAGQIFAGTDVSQLDPALVGRARTMLHLVQGRPLDVLAREAVGDPELVSLVSAAPLWRDGDALSSEALEQVGTSLRAIPQPSASVRLLLALTHAYRGDKEAAEAIIGEILAESPEQASAIALQTHLDDAPTGERGKKKGSRAKGAEDEDDGRERHKRRGARAEPANRPMSTDKLINEGCDAVDAGRAQEAVPTLVKAFDRRPHDVDVLTCLGRAHYKLGNLTTANRYFQLALERSPKFGAALRGAARVAKQSGRRARARELYARLLAVSPSDGEAKRFLAEGGASATDSSYPASDSPSP